MTHPTPESIEEIGKSVHEILNKTITGRLTVAQYSKVVKGISKMLTTLHTAHQNTKADWLRSEIEKLENEKWGFRKGSEECDVAFVKKTGALRYAGEGADTACNSFNQALTSIITRYKEELLELEKGV